MVAPTKYKENFIFSIINFVVELALNYGTTINLIFVFDIKNYWSTD